MSELFPQKLIFSRQIIFRFLVLCMMGRVIHIGNGHREYLIMIIRTSYWMGITTQCRTKSIIQLNNSPNEVNGLSNSILLPSLVLIYIVIVYRSKLIFLRKFGRYIMYVNICGVCTDDKNELLSRCCTDNAQKDLTLNIHEADAFYLFTCDA